MQRRVSRIIVADDHPIVRGGVAGIFAPYPYLQVVGTAGDFDEALQLLTTMPCDILILDIAGMGGPPIMIIERLHREYPNMAIVVFSSSVDLARELMRAGAQAFVAKEEPSEDLLLAINAVRAGQTFISEAARDYGDRYDVERSRQRLAPQELTVLKFIAMGLGTAEIAANLGIDSRTVLNYVGSLKRKTGCEERTQLADWYRRLYGKPE